MTRFVLQENGLTPDDVEYRPVSADGYVGALLAGQIESAILQQEQYFSVAERDKGFHAIVDLYKLEPDWFYGTYFTTTKWLGEHREQAVAFLTALTQAHRFMYDNRAETVRIAAQATGFSREAVDKAYDVLMERNKVFPRNDGLDERRLRYTLGKMGDLKAVSGKVPDVSDIVDRGPVEEAVRKLGRQPGR
jgi:ABC-type nitrate/sulfonate/bicarbonate transport system substrate-binding protein